MARLLLGSRLALRLQSPIGRLREGEAGEGQAYMNRPAPWGAIVTSVAERSPFSVGNASVDPVSRDATWTGGSERLQPQTLKVLIALAGRRGEVVTRDELIQLCWDPVIPPRISRIRSR